MSFFGLFGKKRGGEYALSLDIGTEFVKTIIFKMTAPSEAEVLGIGRQRQRLGDMQGGAVMDIAGVINNCKVAIGQAEEMAGVSPEQTIIGIAGELVKGTTTTVHYTRRDPAKNIEMRELKTIISKVQEKSFEKAREILAWETGYQEIDVKLVNSAVVDVRIDGYKVTNPLGFQGKEVSVGIFNSFAPIIHLGALTTIAENLDLDLLSIAVEPYAVARCVGLEDASEFSAIFMDIGGGTTDIAVVRNGGVEGTKMFALGGRSFTKRLATEFDVSFAQAEEIKINYSGDGLDDASKERVKNAVSSDISVWLSGVELTLSEFSDIELLPSKILLCGGGSKLPDIVEALESDDWYKRLPFAKKPIVSYIKIADVENIIDKTGQLSSPQDITPMALGNLALDLMGEEGVVEGILRRVSRAVRT